MTIAGPNPTRADVIRLAIENRLVDTFVAMPCVVEKYNAQEQSAELRPKMRRVGLDRDGNRATEALPNLPSVPVLFPSGNGFFMKFALQKGDTVLAVVCDREIGSFIETGSDIPGDDRLHSLSGAVCFPVAFKQSGRAPVTSGIAMGNENGTEVLADAQIELRKTAGTPAADFIPLASKVNALWKALTTAVPVQMDGGKAIQEAVRSAFSAINNDVGSQVAKSD